MNTANWTAAARRELDRLLEEHHARLVGTGVDADEVIADLRRHVETELAQDPATAIEPAHVRGVLEPLLAGADAGKSRGTATEHLTDRLRAAQPRLRRKWLLWFLWVVLPLGTFGFELTTGICADMVADPLRSWAHIAAVLSVPLVLGVVLVRIERAPAERLSRYVTALAFMTGISGYFAVLLVHAEMIGVIALLYFGMGLLALSPVLLTLTLGFAIRRVRNLTGNTPSKPRVGPALLAAVLLMLALDARWLVTGVALHQVGSDDPAIRASGERLLRTRWTSESVLLDACERHGHFGSYGFLLRALYGAPASPWEVRNSYFAATGRDYVVELNERRRDLLSADRRRLVNWAMDGMDGRTGTDAQDLSLGSSRLDGLVSPDGLVGYVEWTAVVNNGRQWDREGELTLQLPRGGVVSRVTLWINGEEREAAFGGRAQTIRAYEAVTARRLDPLLVTTSGPDRVALKFFPVPRRGAMKFRIGISFPMTPDGDAAVASVGLPRILHSNLFLSGKFAHEVWYEAHAEPAAVPPGLAQEQSPRGEVALRGALSEAALAETTLRFRRNPRVESVTAPLTGRDDELVLQQLRLVERGTRPRLLVLDGTPHFLRRHGHEVVRALRATADGPLQVIVALDAPLAREFSRSVDAAAFLEQAIGSGAFKAADGTAYAIPGRAGFDNRAALTDGVRRLAGTDGTLLWVHGSQPAQLSFESIVQVLARRDARLTIHELAPERARIRDWAGLDEKLEVASESFSRQHLVQAFGNAAEWSIVRQRVPKASVPAEAPATLRHAARLWVADEVMRQLRSDPALRDAATRLAIEHQVVTPVSGAVVLETAKQYDEHGLKPADPKSVPVVPEPQTYAFMLAAMIGVLVWRRWQMRRARRA